MTVLLKVQNATSALKIILRCQRNTTGNCMPCRSNERLSGSASGQIAAAAAEDPVGDAAGAATMMPRSGSDETSDDILAKYRKKATGSRGAEAATAAAAAPSSSAFQSSSGADGGGGEVVPDGGVVNGDDLEDAVDERLLIDRMNVEGSYAFQVGLVGSIKSVIGHRFKLDIYQSQSLMSNDE